MREFRSFKTARRKPATAMQPAIDPAGWSPDDLKDLSTLATPDTLRRWYGRLVDQAPSQARQGKSLGRPRVRAEIEQLAVRMDKENPTWGYWKCQES